jgi:hypothetical protein
MAPCSAMICQQVPLSGDAEWPKVADAVIEADSHTLKILRYQGGMQSTVSFWRQGEHHDVGMGTSK